MRADRPYKSRPAKYPDTCKRPACPRRTIEVGEEIAYHHGAVMHGVCANAMHGTLPEYAAEVERMDRFRRRHRAMVTRHRELLKAVA